MKCCTCDSIFRWRRAKEEEEGTSKKHVKRPYLATECDNLRDAERWRQQVSYHNFQDLRGGILICEACVDYVE